MFEIGNSLREARLRRSIELAQAEQATKIRRKYLRALEGEWFDQLPSETYVKGFLRTYADYLGLDGQLYVDEYNSRFAAGDDLDGRPRRSSARPSRRNRRAETTVVLAVLAVIATVTVIIISAWQTSGPGAPTTPPAPAATTTAAKVPARSGAYLQITAVHGDSYVAVHRTGPGGRILFQGTIQQGTTEPFRGKYFWVNVSAPENLVISVGGKRVQLAGYKPQAITITPSGVQPN